MHVGIMPVYIGYLPACQIGRCISVQYLLLKIILIPVHA